MIQITSAIRRRQFWEDRRERSLVSWQTRQLATMIAGGYMTDGKGNPALEAASKLAIDAIEAAQLEDQVAKPAAPKINSYEKIQQVFGGMVVVGDSDG
jgi:hypothetical protein